MNGCVMRSVHEPSTHELRSFAFMVGGGFAVVWVYRFFVRGRPGLPLIGLAIALVILGACGPRVLREPYRMWMLLGEWIGAIVSRVLLGTLYFMILTPIATVRRFIVRDPLELRCDGKAASYFRTKRIQSKEQLERMF